MQPVNTPGLAGSVHKTFLKFGPLCLGLSLGLLFSGPAVAQTFTEFEAPAPAQLLSRVRSPFPSTHQG